MLLADVTELCIRIALGSAYPYVEGSGRIYGLKACILQYAVKELPVIVIYPDIFRYVYVQAALYGLLHDAGSIEHAKRTIGYTHAGKYILMLTELIGHYAIAYALSRQ